jgi:hypothetical protein
MRSNVMMLGKNKLRDSGADNDDDPLGDFTGAVFVTDQHNGLHDQPVEHRVEARAASDYPFPRVVGRLDNSSVWTFLKIETIKTHQCEYEAHRRGY